jgi:hypothetical protein
MEVLIDNREWICVCLLIKLNHFCYMFEKCHSKILEKQNTIVTSHVDSSHTEVEVSIYYYIQGCLRGHISAGLSCRDPVLPVSPGPGFSA